MIKILAVINNQYIVFMNCRIAENVCGRFRFLAKLQTVQNQPKMGIF